LIFALNPHKIEPMTKTTTAAIKNHLRPYVSDRLPTIGAVTVEAKRYPEEIKVYLSNPPMSAIILGVAVLTIVWSKAARNMANITHAIVTIIWFRGS